MINYLKYQCENCFSDMKRWGDGDDEFYCINCDINNRENNKKTNKK